MRARALIAAAVVVLASCASGGPATLGYSVPSSPQATYVVADTLTIGLQGLGQEMEIGARSRATYDLSYSSGSGGLRATASLASLAADVVTPMTEPMALSEGAIEGEFVFDLDARGHVVSMSSPQATGGGQVFAAPIVAHTLFPRLPGGASTVGDVWEDSVSYSETTDAGETSVTSILTYTVTGEDRSAGRALLEIGFEGAGTVAQALSIEGATITQTSEVQIQGRLHWDLAAGLLYSSETSMEGPGRVRVALLPTELPTRVNWQTRLLLEDR